MTWSSKIAVCQYLGLQALQRSASCLQRLRFDQHGISSVQFAMILPALAAVVLGTVDMGRLMMAQNTLVHAANEATRFAMVRSASSEHTASKDDIVALVKGRMPGLDSSQAVVNVNWTPENQPGARVTIDIDYPYALATLGTVNLKSSSSTFVTH